MFLLWSFYYFSLYYSRFPFAILSSPAHICSILNPHHETTNTLPHLSNLPHPLHQRRHHSIPSIQQQHNLNSRHHLPSYRNRLHRQLRRSSRRMRLSRHLGLLPMCHVRLLALSRPPRPMRHLLAPLLRPQRQRRRHHRRCHKLAAHSRHDG